MRKQWEDFCRAFVANGENATQAYLEAGYSNKSDRHSVESRASALKKKLLNNVEVSRFIEELKAGAKKKADSKCILDVNTKRKKLAEIINDPGANVFARMKAIDIDNRMEGVYVTKTQLSGEDGGPVRFTWENANA